VITFAGMSHHTAPLDVRERVAIDAEALPAVLQRAKETFGAATIINTCNRLEMYLPGIHEPEAPLGFLAVELGVDHQVMQRHFSVAYGADAVRHLYAVASGIDSMVLGETEVLGQVRSAFSSTVSAGADNAMLSRLFHTAIRTGRRARNETAIGERSVSVSSIAAQQARELFPNLAQASVLMVGAGEAGRLAAEAIVAYGAERLTVANRTFGRAQALADALGGKAIPFADAAEALRTADIVIAASGSPEALFEDAAVSEAVSHRDGQPLLIIDIGVPRDFHPTIREIPGVSYYDLDDLQEVAARNTAARASEVAVVQAIVDEETSRFAEWWSQLQIVPTISAITDRAEELRRSELQKTMRRLKLADEQRAHVEELADVLTRALVRQLLHAPIATLRERGDQDTYLTTVRTLFRLDEPVDVEEA
jgi:glutamyl-tRNA reductase